MAGSENQVRDGEEYLVQYQDKGGRRNVCLRIMTWGASKEWLRRKLGSMECRLGMSRESLTRGGVERSLKG